jgi:hypothetical protein
LLQFLVGIAFCIPGGIGFVPRFVQQEFCGKSWIITHTNGTQIIFFSKNQSVTIPVPGTKMLKPALVAGFTVKGSIPIPFSHLDIPKAWAL